MTLVAASLLLALGPGGGTHGPPGPGPFAGEPGPDTASTHRIVEGETILAVVTRRAGIAGRFAHDHLIVAPRYGYRLILHGEDPGGSSFELTVRAEDLEVDDGPWQEAVQERLQELGIMDGPFQGTDAGERERIREAIRSRDQLHAEAHPEIFVRTGEVRARDDPVFPREVEIELIVRGDSARAWAPVRLERDGDRLLVEGHADFRFTHFGIEPYSAYLGLVRTRDPFHLYLRMVAEPTEIP